MIAGTPSELATSYDTATIGEQNGQWRYVTVLAASGQMPVFLPEGTSRWPMSDLEGAGHSQN